MAPRFQDFQFALTYELAGNIRDEIFLRPDNGWLNYLEDFFAIDESFIQKATAPRKLTFLHGIIEYYIGESLDYMVRKGDYWESAEVLERILDGYGVPRPKHATGSDEDHYTREDVDGLLKLVEVECQQRMVDEVFTLLFADRAFLLELNEAIAEVVAASSASIHPDLLERDGAVRRCTYWPTWVTDALYFRDKGRCALCLKDISGLLAAGREQHIDHMVPLASGGTNDPINLQFLCPTCNLTKGTKGATSGKMSLFW